MISSATIEKVKDLGLEEVIKTYVELKKSGANYRGLSPFVNEKSPSFMVSPSKNVWKCFSGGKGGMGHISFVMEQQSFSFPEAITEIAKNHNIEIEYDDSEDAEQYRKIAEEKKTLHDVNYRAWEIFKREAEGLDLETLRVSKDLAETYGVGYAANKWTVIYDELIAAGYSKRLIEEAGLVTTGQNGVRDFFKDRVIFPIYDTKGKYIVGFSGRAPKFVQGAKFPKYLNTKETKIFSKSKSLLGIQVALPFIHNLDKCFVTEGNYDVPAMYEKAGYGNTVSPLGTSFTEAHALEIKKLTNNICFVFDGDQAGFRASLKAIEMCVALDLFVEVVFLPENQDPDSFEGNLQEYIDEETQDGVIWLADQFFKDAKSIQEMTKAESKLENLLAEIPNNKLRNSYVKAFTQKYKISKAAIEKSIKAVLVQKRIASEGEEPKYKVPNGVTIDEIEEWRFYEINKRGDKYTGYHFLGQGGTFEQKSNFVIKPLFHAYSKTDNKRVLEISNQKMTKIVQVSSKALNNIALFEETLVNEGNFYFDGEKKDWQRVRRKILGKFPKCNEIKTLGLQDEGFYAFANGIIDNRFIKIDTFGIVNFGEDKYFLPALSKINEGVRDDEDEYESEKNFIYKKGTANLSSWANLFCEVNGNNGKIATCYFIASIFRDLLFSYASVYPHLFLFGQVQTGKSVCARGLNAVFHEDTTPFNLTAGTDTGFSRRLAREINSLVWWDEYDNDLKENRYNALKMAFDGVGREIGVKSSDNKTKTVKVRSSSIISGQYLPTIDDNALFTRSILLTFDKKANERTTEDGDNLQKLLTIEKEGLSQIILEVFKFRDVVENKYKETISELFAMFKQDLKGETYDGRILQNFILMLTPFKIIENKIKLPFTFPDIYELSKEMILSQTDQINSSDSLANYWKTIEYLYAQNMIAMNIDFKIESVNHLKVRDKKKDVILNFPQSKKCLFLRFTKVQPLYAEAHRKQHGINGVSESSIKVYMGAHKAFLGNCPATGFDNTKTSAYVFDYDMLPVELEGFAKQKVKKVKDQEKVDEDENDNPFD